MRFWVVVLCAALSVDTHAAFFPRMRAGFQRIFRRPSGMISQPRAARPSVPRGPSYDSESNSYDGNQPPPMAPMGPPGMRHANPGMGPGVPPQPSYPGQMAPRPQGNPLPGSQYQPAYVPPMQANSPYQSPFQQVRPAFPPGGLEAPDTRRPAGLTPPIAGRSAFPPTNLPPPPQTALRGMGVRYESQLVVGDEAMACGFTFTDKIPTGYNPDAPPNSPKKCFFSGIQAAHCVQTRAEAGQGNSAADARTPSFLDFRVKTPRGLLKVPASQVKIDLGPRYLGLKETPGSNRPNFDDFARVSFETSCDWIPDQDLAEIATGGGNPCGQTGDAGIQVIRAGGRRVVAQVQGVSSRDAQCVGKFSQAGDQVVGGDSGGPIYDSFGRIIGVISSAMIPVDPKTGQRKYDPTPSFSYASGAIDFFRNTIHAHKAAFGL